MVRNKNRLFTLFGLILVILLFGSILVSCNFNGTGDNNGVLFNDNFEFTYLRATDTYEVTKYIGVGNTAVIPETFNEKSVTSVGEKAFYNCSDLTSIDMPEVVTNIGSDAFYGCSSITSLDVPDGVASIRTRAFYGCSRLKTVNLPSSLQHIEASAFYGCSSLEEINFPD